jgi:8-amino-7-oxononanoate synthase
MDSSLAAALREDRALREAQCLQRDLRWLDDSRGAEVIWEGRSLINFSSNDYLGLSHHPALKSAACAATDKYGAGAGASRLVCGTLPPHRELEEALAKFKGTEAALTFSTGYAAAVGTICALVGAGDVVVIDKLAHASLVDGARLSGATPRVFKHNDLASLEAKLQWARAEAKARRVLVVTESVFSMDGDVAPIRDLAELKERYGAWLMVDEAHAFGVVGANGCGLVASEGQGRVEAQMGTLGKAAGAAGGFIAGSAALIDHLINSARSFVFSTAPTPGSAAAARAGLEIIASGEGDLLRKRLQDNLARLRLKLSLPAPIDPSASTAIVPIILGAEARALEVSEHLKNAGFLVPAIRYPTVARGAARLRVTMSAAHSREQIDALAAELALLISRGV